MITGDCLKTERDIFKRYLKDKGLRATQERFRILNSILKFQGHFDVEQMLKTLESDGFHISKATIYSTFELLCECGVIRRLHFSPQQAVYELSENNHIHLVCIHCGNVTESQITPDSLSLDDIKEGNFDAKFISIYIYGVCAKCKK